MNIQYTDVKGMIEFLKAHKVARFKCAEFEVEIHRDYDYPGTLEKFAIAPARDPLAIDDPPETVKEPTEDELLFYSARGRNVRTALVRRIRKQGPRNPIRPNHGARKSNERPSGR